MSHDRDARRRASERFQKNPSWQRIGRKEESPRATLPSGHAACGTLALHNYAQGTSITTVTPLTAKAGDTVSAKGEGIDSAKVDTLYLTDGTHDFKCQMVEQTATAIKFKVPDMMQPGRWTVMIHTKKDQLIEQPVKLTVQ